MAERDNVERRRRNTENMKRYYAANPEKYRAKARAYYHANKEKIAQRRKASGKMVGWLRENRKKYALRREEMLNEQGGVCAICGAGSAKRWHLDHCHSSGKVRGVLCSECNTGIGKLHDSASLLRRAAEYLEAT